MTPAALDARLCAAHTAGDRQALVGLYGKAAEASDHADSAGFFLTQAYVFALEISDPRAADLRRALVGMGREAP